VNLPQELIAAAVIGIAKKPFHFIWNKIKFRPVIERLTTSEASHDLLISSVESVDFSVEEIDTNLQLTLAID